MLADRPGVRPDTNICSILAAMRAEYREEPCQGALNRVHGHAVRLVAQPVHGLRAPLHVLLRPRLRAARRPARRTTATARRSASRSTSPRCSGAELARPLVAAASRSRSAPRPTRTSRPRAATGSRARCLEALAAAANPFSLITRGPLIVRDVDVLAEAARRASVSVVVLGADARPGGLAPDRARAPRRRASGCGRSRGSSTPASRVSVGMAPILPGISDSPEQLAAVVRAAREAGACGIWANVLHLQARARASTSSPCLARDWPELAARVRAALRRGARTSAAADVEPVRTRVRELARAARRSATAAASGRRRRRAPEQLRSSRLMQAFRRRAA